MSRRRSQSELSVSLFPFLAVLVCAMGALILLLLIITRQVRSQAMSSPAVDELETIASQSLSPVLQPARIELAETHAPAMLPQKNNQWPSAADALKFDEQKDGNQSRIRLLNRQKEELQNSRLQQKLIQMQITELTSRLADEKKRNQKLQTNFVSLSRRKDELKKKSSPHKSPSQQTRDRLTRLQKELLEKQHELKAQKQIASEILGKLQIVTYDGATGIRRKPIFIECVAGNVIFQPEKVKVSSEDLERYSSDTHPLGFASRALNEYRNKKSGSQEPAYVLLIVRPNGIDEFYSTRRVLGVQGISFGYELVGQKQEFYFNQPDAQAKKVIEESLTQSRQSARQKRRGGLHLAGNGNSPRGTQRPENRNRTPGGNTNNLPKRTGKFNSSGEHLHGSHGQSSQRNLTDKKNRRGGSEFKNSRPSNSRGLAKNGTRNSPSKQSPLGRGKSDSAQSQRRNSSQSSSKQPTSNASTPKEQLERMLSQGEGLGNPNIFPQLNSLSSRAKQLNRGTPNTLISFERQLSIKITPGSLQVGTQKPVSISELETDISTQRKFLNSLEREMSKWPAPPRGFRWVPGFQLVVSPGGNQIAFRLEAVAKELKLRTETKFSMGNANSNNPF